MKFIPSKRCEKFIQSFEGYHTKLHNGDCQAYLDKLASKKSWSKGYRGLWTIGWGSTGPDVTEGTVWTREKADEKLREHIMQKAFWVNKYINDYKMDWVDQNQFDAMCSGAYNFGEGNLKKLLVKSDFSEEQIAKNWRSFATNGGIPGLVRRRKEEVALFNEYTPTQVVESSRQLTLIQRTKNSLAALGLSGTAILSTLPGFFTDWRVVTVLAATGFLSVGAWLVANRLQKQGINAVKEGRYRPSKMTIPAMDN